MVTGLGASSGPGGLARHGCGDAASDRGARCAAGSVLVGVEELPPWAGRAPVVIDLAALERPPQLVVVELAREHEGVDQGSVEEELLEHLERGVPQQAADAGREVDAGGEAPGCQEEVG